jgi:hypothetical protein
MCHHAIFGKAWYLQLTRPPAAQLLYDLGLESKSNFVSLHGPLHPTPPGTIEPILPPTLRSKPSWKNPLPSLLTPLSLCITEGPVQITACVAQVKTTDKTKTLTKKQIAAEVVSHYLIGSRDMTTIYISPDAYRGAFEEELNLQKFGFTNNWTVGLHFIKKDNCLILASIDLSTQLHKFLTGIIAFGGLGYLKSTAHQYPPPDMHMPSFATCPTLMLKVALSFSCTLKLYQISLTKVYQSCQSPTSHSTPMINLTPDLISWKMVFAFYVPATTTLLSWDTSKTMLPMICSLHTENYLNKTTGLTGSNLSIFCLTNTMLKECSATPLLLNRMRPSSFLYGLIALRFWMATMLCLQWVHMVWHGNG